MKKSEPSKQDAKETPENQDVKVRSFKVKYDKYKEEKDKKISPEEKEKVGRKKYSRRILS